MIRTAPEGRWFIIVAWAVALVLVFVALRAGSTGWWISTVAWLALSVWVVAFFRDPVRTGSRGVQYFLAPADGKVVSIKEIDEPAFMCGRATRISIFMNVFNCHVNRYPADGAVAYRHYVAGRFVHAASEKSSLDNEQSSVGLNTPRGKLLIRQIAGLIARRIVTDHPVGAEVRQGERMGMICFGSRVDLFLPTEVRVLARVGDTTLAGVTVVAQWS